MLIKKEASSSNDMIYPYYPNHTQSETAWTKVYFIIIFACVYDENASKMANSGDRMCLQNSLNDVNDTSEIVNELKKVSTQLMPAYVSNISYEAYSSDSKRRKNTPGDDTSSVNRENSSAALSTTLVVCVAISLLVGISLALTVLIRQNAVAKRMMIKAPIWYPPPLNGSQDAGFNKCPKLGDYSSNGILG